ncbi:uncharacterized protein LOC115011631 [Cottoperca gobio]|uniref:Uncharacterized protein LOC115011631 n=1 Tax=Cottoperca gobio TaxID=56716 RepID=A0A6J2Q568_COTGO|nr:uncharacterized protein LOC115011631 [Cottoperca gobio]
MLENYKRHLRSDLENKKMGNMESWEREREREMILDIFVQKLGEGPDLKVNNSIEKFTGLASSDNLTQHYEKRKMEASDCTAGWIKNLVEKLANLTPAPALAGLGAFAIAVFIDVVSFSPPEDSTKDSLRCVFAEEKASEVWDQIDECLKRCMAHIKNKDELRSNIERIECQLSAALTKLKNSMLRDNHMSSQALKAWVNGAAFHIQMLIHLVRLGGIQTCDPVKGFLSTYQSDLDTLFKKHKEFIKEKCYYSIWSLVFNFPCLVDEDSKSHYLRPHALGSYALRSPAFRPRALDPHISFDRYVEALYEHRYSRQMREVQLYFSDVTQNLQRLVEQRGYFNV